MARRTLLSTLGQRRFVRVARGTSRSRAQGSVMERAEALGWEPGPFPTPGEAEEYLARLRAAGGRWVTVRGRPVFIPLPEGT